MVSYGQLNASNAVGLWIQMFIFGSPFVKQCLKHRTKSSKVSVQCSIFKTGSTVSCKVRLCYSKQVLGSWKFFFVLFFNLDYKRSGFHKVIKTYARLKSWEMPFTKCTVENCILSQSASQLPKKKDGSHSMNEFNFTSRCIYINDK